jgi:hypothetical protein
MIQRLKKITDGLYRGSAPSPADIYWLKENLRINKIISLDKHCGQMIDRVCKKLNIAHIIIPLDHTRKSLLKLFKYDLKKLLLEDGPTYIHCFAGKDRTGFVSALFECKYMGKDPELAIKEAESMGFGLDLDPEYKNMIEIYKKIIRRCKSSKDENNADIVSNEREYISDNRSSFLDEGHQGSFAPYLSVTKQDPIDSVYNYINDQSPTRENYDYNKSIKEHNNDVPQVGVFNNDAGGRGFGPTENYSGFFYD